MHAQIKIKEPRGVEKLVEILQNAEVVPPQRGGGGQGLPSIRTSVRRPFHPAAGTAHNG